jgi:hypothetical protein
MLNVCHPGSACWLAGRHSVQTTNGMIILVQCQRSSNRSTTAQLAADISRWALCFEGSPKAARECHLHFAPPGVSGGCSRCRGCQRRCSGQSSRRKCGRLLLLPRRPQLGKRTAGSSASAPGALLPPVQVGWREAAALRYAAIADVSVRLRRSGPGQWSGTGADSALHCVVAIGFFPLCAIVRGASVAPLQHVASRCGSMALLRRSMPITSPTITLSRLVALRVFWPLQDATRARRG